MEVIAYKEGDSVYIVSPALNDKGAIINPNWKTRSNIPENAIKKEMDSSELPSRVFRDSWKLENSKVDLDIAKAKIAAHEIRREKRTEAMKDNIALIQKDSMGIPLKEGDSVTAAKKANADYKKDIDDVIQTTIDAAKSESGLLGALGL